MKKILFLVICMMSQPAMAAWQTAAGGGVTVSMGAHVETWATWYQDTHGSTAVDSVIGSDGGVYVAGTRQRALDAEMVLMKFTPEGVLEWGPVVYGSGVLGGNDEAVQLMIDGFDNLYLLGLSGGGVSQDVLIRKYDASGTLIWGEVLNGGAANIAVKDEPIDMVLDEAGDPYVLMASYSQGNNAMEDIFVAHLKQDATGSSVTIESMSYGDSVVYERPVAITVDSAGKTFVAATRLEDNKEDILVLKLDVANANVEWGHVFATVARDRAVDIGLDSLDRVYVSGMTWRSGLPGFVTFSLLNTLLDSAGNPIIVVGNGEGSSINGLPITKERWVNQDNTGFNPAFTVPYTMLVTGDDEIYIAGKKKVISNDGINVQEEEDLIIVKYNSLGAQLWKTLYDNGVVEHVEHMAVDDNGVLFAAVESDDAVGLMVVSHDGAVADFVSSAQGYDEHPTSLVLDTKLLPDDGLETVAYITAGGFPGKIIEGDLTLFKYEVARADLSLAAIGNSPMVVSEGMYMVTDSIENVKDNLTGRLGNIPIAFNVVYDLVGMTGTATDGMAYRLGTRSISNLTSGALNTMESSYLVPDVATLLPGFYSFVVSIDETGGVLEYTRHNNVVNTGTVELVDPPELVAVSVQPQGAGAVLAAGTFMADFKIDNTRNNAAGAFDVSFFLTPNSAGVQANAPIDLAVDIPLTVIDGAGNPSSTLYISTGVPGVDPVTFLNGSYTGSVELLVPNDIVAPDNYTLGMYVDTGDVILEPDDVFNVLRDPAGIVNVGSIVDLTVASVSSQYGAVVGDNVAVRYTIQASNDGNASGFSNKAYLSRDEIKSNDDMEIGVDNSSFLDGLPANTLSQEKVIDAVIPLVESDMTTLVSGLYYILVEADAGATVNENNENNNMGYFSRKIVIGDGALPDLVIASVTTAVATARPNDPITITGDVENVMPVDVAGPVAVAAYLSVDNQITSDDYLIGSTELASVAANNIVPYTIDGTVPSEVRLPVTWTRLFGTHVEGTVLVSEGRSTGASSTESFVGNGYAEYRINEASAHYFGLNDLDTGISRTDINYALLMTGTQFLVYEHGSRKAGFAQYNYSVGDMVRVRRVGETVTYSWNGLDIYTSTTPIPATTPLFADVAYNTGGVKGVSDAYISTIVVMPGQNFYLGAIVDEQGAVGSVVEVSEDNNAWYMEEVGGAELFPIAVIETQQSSTRSGGGQTGLGLLALLMSGLLLRRKINNGVVISSCLISPEASKRDTRILH